MKQFLTSEKTPAEYGIAGVRIGGKPGEIPTVLIGSIFYEKDKTVEDSGKGLFDKERAKSLVGRQEELSTMTGNPHMVDVMGLTPEAMRNYIDFISEITDAPLVLDSTSAEAKIAALQYAEEIGLMDRVVYNSITPHTNQEEIAALQGSKVNSAILLAANPSNAWPPGRIEILEGEEGLLALARNAGIGNTLVDAVTLDVPGIGITAESVQLIKESFGIPVGAAPCNAVLEWKRVKEFGPQSRNINMANAASILQMNGANFILYGPIRMAEMIFPACAMTDAIIAYGMRKHGVRPKKPHPLYQIF